MLYLFNEDCFRANVGGCHSNSCSQPLIIQRGMDIVKEWMELNLEGMVEKCARRNHMTWAGINLQFY